MRRRVLAAAAAMTIALAAGPSFAQETLTVCWVKGFYKSEDEALYAAIKKFEAKTGVEVELSQYAIQDMNAKSVAALDAGTPPDIAYSDTYDVQTAGKWAFDGKLEDISDVIGPMKHRFAPVTIETAFLWNEYLYAFLLLSRETAITLPVALGNFLSADDSPWELLMTAGFIYPCRRRSITPSVSTCRPA